MPRPRKHPDARRQTVGLTLDPRLLTAAKEVCFKKGRSLSETVDALLIGWVLKAAPGTDDAEEAIDRFIAEHEKRERQEMENRRRRRGATAR